MLADFPFARHLLDIATRTPWWSSLLILAIAFSFAGALHFVTRSLQANRYEWQKRLRVWLGVAPDKRFGELSWLLLAVDLLLLQLVLYLILHVWGWHDEGEAMLRALFDRGFTIGGTRIVLGKLLFGVLLFVLLFTFTRWLKRKLEFDWLVRARVEPSTRDAAATLFGYASFVIAALVGLSFAGVDFGKLAIVAGALSVGIGFGLQNIVSNFVSGLILLFERPIRSGDYIMVGDSEGTVRRIRIRATELETGDHDTLIVPNSVLLSSQVRNRDLRARHGRVVLAIGVAYGSDVEKVRQVLLDVAAAHPAVIRGGQIIGVPAPVVRFVNFGDSALAFELQAQILEAEQRSVVASDLRFAIDAAFRRERIEMPFVQRDLHIRSLPQGFMTMARGARDDADS